MSIKNNLVAVSACLACGSSEKKSIEQTQAMMHPPPADGKSSPSDNFNFDQYQKCGLVYLNPRVPAERLKEYYSSWYLPYRGDAAWGKYGFLVATDQKKVDDKRVKTVQKYVNIKPDTVVLDVGCGKPDFLQLLHQQSPCRAIGFDFVDDGWALSKSIYKDLELHVGEIDLVQELPAPEVITMWHYLEHDYDPGYTLRTLREKANASTYLIIEVPNFDSKTRKNFGPNWAGYHTPRHTALYTPETLTTLLENNGWEMVDSYAHGTLDPYTLRWMSQQEQKGLDWSKSMEEEFWGYVRGKVAATPLGMLEKKVSLGFMTGVARVR